MSVESRRLEETSTAVPWKKWGPYLSERQWGTVREDYSEDGDAWNYFPHDHARSRAYRWGEDGLAGISDDRQLLCFALALWNGRDPILKERLFGLTNSEGNHGEDVKEYYFYLDSTPTHSFMRYLYKYPQNAYPYEQIVKINSGRGREEREFELLDTGVFEQERYFDCFVEYAKADPEDLLIEITLVNRGSEEAQVHVLPTLWFRNTWSWEGDAPRPLLKSLGQKDGFATVMAEQERLGQRYFYCEGSPELLFTENETNTERLSGQPNPSPYVKDGINAYVVEGKTDAVNPDLSGTKVTARYILSIPAGASQTVRLRLSPTAPGKTTGPFGSAFAKTMQARKNEADEFYRELAPAGMSEDGAQVMRQALAGMLWSKQFYYFDLNRWLEERGNNPFKATDRQAPRNGQWHHMYNADIISMPDKWEYPWYAAWDLAFHAQPLTLVDLDFAKGQLDLMLREHYMHPNGQIPAYEWNFGDVNPPVHAWATIFTYMVGKYQGRKDFRWLERCFQKLLLNFTWWVNRKDRNNKNVFEGGFLGLDNIAVFDRSKELPTGGNLEQADGTAWMTLFCQNMLEIALELAEEDPSYTEMALKFMEHTIWIASSMTLGTGGVKMWDEEDGFFYDVLRLPDGTSEQLKVRSVVGLLPLCAATVFSGSIIERFPEIMVRFRNFLSSRCDLVESIQDVFEDGVDGRRLSAVLNRDKLRRVLSKVLDESEFLSPHGIRSLSRYHKDHPYVFSAGGQEYRVEYLPAESDSGMFGGNSNWRGPVWMPINAMLIRALVHYYGFYGDDFKIECPTGSGVEMTLYQVAEELARRLNTIFMLGADGKRPVFEGMGAFQTDPHWRDNILFFEYFDGETGAGLGASHQTGWTGLVARSLHLFATITPERVLASGKIF